MKFKKRKNSEFSIQTSSLPDIVFILLFFFMVVTTIKTKDPEFIIDEPKTKYQDVIKNQSLVDHIHVGKFKGTEVIHLNDGISNLKEIQSWIEMNTKLRPEEDRNKIVRALHIDQDIKMEIVQEIKKELRSSNALKILYSTKPQSK